MMKFEIKEEWKSLLSENGFKEYEDFFKDHEGLELLTMERSASVKRVQLDGSNGKSVFFLKRCFSERPRKVLRRFLRGGLYRQPAVVEKDNLIFLQERGFNVMQIAAWGEQRTMGYPMTSFLLVPKVEGEEFIDFYRNNDCRLRTNLYKEFGKLVGRLHCQGIDSIVRPQDLFCQKNSQTDIVSLTLIDREEGSTVISQPDIGKITQEMAEMFVKGVIRYQQVAITIREALLFYKNYLLVNANVQLTEKELHLLVVEKIKSYIRAKKFAQAIIPLLPKKTFGDLDVSLL